MAGKDFYKTLGVEKSASQEDIKKAFRKLAMQHHPDKNKGDDTKFKELNEAYQTLSDEKKRAQYDQFGSDAPNMGGGGYGGFQGGFNPNDFGFDFSGFGGQGGGAYEMNDIGDIFSTFFNGGRPRTPKGRNISAGIELTFKESIFGVDKEIALEGVGVKTKEKKVTVKIPAGIESGETLRVKGYGEMIDNGDAGDLMVQVAVRPDGTYRKIGANLVRALEIKLSDALLGGSYELETLDGKLTMKIPVGIQSGEVLRVKEKGVPVGKRRGDLLVTITIKIPDKLSKEAKKAAEKLKEEGF
jgi:DnaJ-class molecular chaperone